MTSLPLRFTSTARTDTGLVRKANEDAMLTRPEIGMWAVADGMGGYKNGRMAADCVVDQLEAVAYDADIKTLCFHAAESIHDANRRIHDQSTNLGESMGSTVVCLLTDGQRFAVLWAGDSRAYLLRGDEMIRLTRDHTQVQDMIDLGLMTEEEGRDHPMSHVLSRAIGVQATLELDVITDRCEAGDIFLLCSDGVHGVAPEADIQRLLASLAPSAACDALISLCHARNAPDNATLVVVVADAATALAQAPVGARP